MITKFDGKRQHYGNSKSIETQSNAIKYLLDAISKTKEMSDLSTQNSEALERMRRNILMMASQSHFDSLIAKRNEAEIQLQQNIAERLVAEKIRYLDADGCLALLIFLGNDIFAECDRTLKTTYYQFLVEKMHVVIDHLGDVMRMQACASKRTIDTAVNSYWKDFESARPLIEEEWALHILLFARLCGEGE